MTTTIERHARTNDPITSKIAAGLLTEEDLSKLQQDLYKLLAAEPATHDRLYDRYRAADLPPRSPQRVRTAVREMVDGGLVRAAGELGESGFHNPSQVWEVAR